MSDGRLSHEQFAAIVNAVPMNAVGTGDAVLEREPYATHEGVLTIGGYDLRIYQLSNGERVIDAEDFMTFFGVENGGPEKRP